MSEGGCMLCDMMAAVAVSPLTTDDPERLWMSAYMRGVGDALSDRTFSLHGACERHTELFRGWLSRYLSVVYDRRPQEYEPLAAKFEALFGIEIVRLEHGPH